MKGDPCRHEPGTLIEYHSAEKGGRVDAVITGDGPASGSCNVRHLEDEEFHIFPGRIRTVHIKRDNR